MELFGYDLSNKKTLVTLIVIFVVLGFFTANLPDSDEESDEETAYILKDLSDDVDSEANYEILEDDNEIEYVAKIFAELLDDVDIEK